MSAASHTALFAVLALVTGCASTPQASPARDALAKEFRSHPAASSVYIYRAASGRFEDEDTTLYIDGRLIGATLPRTFFLVHLHPGEHLLAGIAADNGRLQLETRPGELYFVALGVTASQSRFEITEPLEARRAIVSCCALLENWAPGQRPLLR